MEVPDPAIATLRDDIEAPAVVAGAAAEMWQIVDLSWPFLIVGIRAGDGTTVHMRLDVTGYPGMAPAGQLWDLQASSPLQADKWPQSPTLSLVFRTDWSPGNGNAPYLACDRMALAGHPDWATQNPAKAWNPNRTIDFYLGEIHRELSVLMVTPA